MDWIGRRGAPPVPDARFESTRDGDGGVRVRPGVRSLFKLAFLPIDAKNPPERPCPFERGIWYVRAFGASATALRIGLAAREGYGRYAGGTLVDDRSSPGLMARSVALYASARTGNDISDDIDPPETCLGIGGISLGSMSMTDSDLDAGGVRDDLALAATDH